MEFYKSSMGVSAVHGEVGCNGWLVVLQHPVQRSVVAGLDGGLHNIKVMHTFTRVIKPRY